MTTEARKLAAIFPADVVGFSRLTGADEDRTLARLRTLRSDLIDPTIAVHKGRVVKRTGHGLLSFDDQSAALVKPNRRTCAALARKRTFAADTMGDGDAQTAVMPHALRTDKNRAEPPFGHAIDTIAP